MVKTKRNEPRMNLQPGMTLGRNYFVMDFLGSGWEGEVYKVEERDTGILRAAKIFYERPGLRKDQVRRYARKLYKLRKCTIITQYHHRDIARVGGQSLRVLVSDFSEGELLSSYIKRIPGKRMPVYEALHLLHALAMGVEQIHQLGEYHADIHGANILLKRRGISFDISLIDFFDLGRATKVRIQDDVYHMIQLFYQVLGGKDMYWKVPQGVRDIIKGRRYDLIAARYKTAGQLRVALENMEW